MHGYSYIFFPQRRSIDYNSEFYLILFCKGTIQEIRLSFFFSKSKSKEKEKKYKDRSVPREDRQLEKEIA